MEEILIDICGNTNFSDLTELNLSNKKLTAIESAVLNKCVSLEKLDVSRNRIKSFLGVFLPNLTVFNFEDNSVSDVTFLCDLPSLEKLYIDGNPLNVADRYIAVDQLPNLKLLDGKCCADIKKILQQFEQHLNAEAMRLYSTKYEPDLKTSGFEQIVRQRRLFTRELMSKVSSCSSIPPKFQRYKVQAYVEKLFKNIETPCSPRTPRKGSTELVISSPSCVLKKLNNLHLSSPTISEEKLLSPTTEQKLKNLSLASSSRLKCSENLLPTPVLLQRKLEGLKLTKSKRERLRKNITSVEGVESDKSLKGKKRKLAIYDTEERCLNYNPEIFLRCHVPTNDPQDCNTQVWAAKFEINNINENKTTDLVATCGGNIVCFINCQTGHVVMRYKCECKSENLFALDWTILQSGERKQRTSVLAAGGAEMKIYLIHPSQLKCYLIFKAHTKQINCLQFHPTERSWLFSSSKDSYIHLWDIGELSLPNYSTKHKKLMTFEAQGEVEHILLSESYNCLFASMDESLGVWNLNSETSSQRRKPSIVLTIPESCKSEKIGTIDGLALVSDTCIAFKVSSSGKIVLWDPTSIFPDGKLARKRFHEITPTAIFLWSECDSVYSDIGCCRSDSIIACGDNSGRLWMYDIQKYSKNEPCSFSYEISLPSIVLPWPKLAFENESLCMQQKVTVNSVHFNWNGDYLVACTDTNLVCIWKRD